MHRVHELKSRIVRQGQERRRQRLEAEKAQAKQEGEPSLPVRSPFLPPSLKPASWIRLIQELQALRHELALYSDIEVRITIQD